MEYKLLKKARVAVINILNRASITANSASVNDYNVAIGKLVYTSGSFGSSLGCGTSMTGTEPLPYFSRRDSGWPARVGRLSSS